MTVADYFLTPLGIAYLTVAENNDFRFSAVLDRADRLDSGRSTRGEVLELIERCNAIEPAGSGDLGEAFVEYADLIQTRSLVLVAGDFLTDIAGIADGVSALAEHDVELGHVIAPADLDPVARGDTVFEDMESDRTRRTHFGPRLQADYRDRVEAHVASVEDRAEGAGARHHRIVTGGDFFDAFSRVWVG